MAGMIPFTSFHSTVYLYATNNEFQKLANYAFRQNRNQREKCKSWGCLKKQNR